MPLIWRVPRETFHLPAHVARGSVLPNAIRYDWRLTKTPYNDRPITFQYPGHPVVEFSVTILLCGVDSSKRLRHEFNSEFSGVWRAGD